MRKMQKPEIGSSNGLSKGELFDQLLRSTKQFNEDITEQEKINRYTEILFSNMHESHVAEYMRQYAIYRNDRDNHRKPFEGKLLSRVFKLLSMNYLKGEGNLMADPPDLRIVFEEGERLIQEDRDSGASMP